MAVDFGILLTPGPAKGVSRRWLDDLDACLPLFTGHVKSLWVSDHFFWDDAPTYEAWTTMAYLAARYPQFDIGSSVLGQGYRNPAMLAKSVATLQDLSNGRCILGIGAGWKEDEHDAYGYPFGSPGVRLQQLEDTLEIVKRLWREPGKLTYRGKHYHITDAYCEPKPSPIPLIMVGGAGNKTIKLAARYADMWNLSDAAIARYQDRLTVVKQACAAINRDLATLRLSWLGRLVPAKTDAEARERAESQGRNHSKVGSSNRRLSVHRSGSWKGSRRSWTWVSLTLCSRSSAFPTRKWCNWLSTRSCPASRVARGVNKYVDST